MAFKDNDSVEVQASTFMAARSVSSYRADTSVSTRTRRSQVLGHKYNVELCSPSAYLLQTTSLEPHNNRSRTTICGVLSGDALITKRTFYRFQTSVTC